MRVAILLLVTACSFRGRTQGTHTDDAKTDAPDPAEDAAVDAARTIDAPGDAFACSTVGLTCAGAAGLVVCNNACWAWCPDNTLHVEAAARCVAWGGKLAPMTTTADQDCVIAIPFNPDASWIGLEQTTSATIEETGWSWNGDGQGLAYTNWAGGQPNDNDGMEDGEEQCAYLSTSETWHDTPCGVGLFNFSCRR